MGRSSVRRLTSRLGFGPALGCPPASRAAAFARLLALRRRLRRAAPSASWRRSSSSPAAGRAASPAAAGSPCRIAAARCRASSSTSLTAPVQRLRAAPPTGSSARAPVCRRRGNWRTPTVVAAHAELLDQVAGDHRSPAAGRSPDPIDRSSSSSCSASRPPISTRSGRRAARRGVTTYLWAGSW